MPPTTTADRCVSARSAAHLGFWLGLCLVAGLGGTREAGAQSLQRTCLPGDARSQGLDAPSTRPAGCI